jgi:MarR family transcriptional regulator, organic hydroperoxide resistance regulator
MFNGVPARHAEAWDMSPSEAPSGGPAEEFLPDLLARAAHMLIRGFAEELRARGASLPVWRALAALLARPSETVTGLAEACLLQQPTMTKLLDRMTRDGLVRRTQDSRDRRVVRVALTPRGAELVIGLLEAAKRHEAEVLARHPETEADDLKGLLRVIIARHSKPRQA